MTATIAATETIAGIRVPDSGIAQDATALVRDVTDDLLYEHSRRVFLFGSLRGRLERDKADPELLYVAAMFHDLGLTEAYRTAHQRFEIDGADEARRFLLSYGIDAAAADTVWNAIALHTTPEIPLHMAPEVAWLRRGVELDVMGVGYDAITPEQREDVVAAHPRAGFKQRILSAFTDGLEDRPHTSFGTVNADVLAHCRPGYRRTDFVELIENSPWTE